MVFFKKLIFFVEEDSEKLLEMCFLAARTELSELLENIVFPAVLENVIFSGLLENILFFEALEKFIFPALLKNFTFSEFLKGMFFLNRNLPRRTL